ncbi:MAG: glycosyltransferase WbuB [Oceanospirillales bacterium]|nr:glycosyltransferase WbuB [Oceanospirillales bacterium]
MKFLLYSLNYSPELTGIGKYNGELAPSLSSRGVETNVLTAPPYYPDWNISKGFKNRWSTVQCDSVTVFRCPLFVPSKLTTVKRLLHLSSFAITSALRLLSLIRLKPDVLFLVQPTLFCAPFALLYCKLTGAKSVMHIQDFEVDAMFGLGMGGSGRLSRVANAAERWLLKRFDVVSSISYSMLDNAVAKGVSHDKLIFFPNWSDTGFVTPDVDGSELRTLWGYTPDDKVVLYSGNIGQKQGLDIVLDAAESFKHRPEVKFLIIGNGSYSETLQGLARERGLSNVSFKPLQAWEDVPNILAMADVHLVVQKRGAADAVLPSKLTNILSAGGNAVVTAESNTELGKIAEKYPGIYTCVEPENLSAFIAGLESCFDMTTDQPNIIARNYAVENLNKDKVIDRFIQDLKAHGCANL